MRRRWPTTKHSHIAHGGAVNRSLLAMALVLATGSASAIEDTQAKPEAGIEFLWSGQAEGAPARQPTLGFLIDGKAGHLVCVVAFPPEAKIRGLVLEGVDAAGKVVVREEEPDFTGRKMCYSAGLDGHGEPGRWTYRAYFNGATVPAGVGHIEVARSLDTAGFYQPSGVPYVLGRPNYDPSIPPEDFKGRLVWVMHVDRDGKVTGVEIEAAEGVGTRMKDRALAAGHLSMFPPDPARPADFTYRRELLFSPE